MARRTDEPDRVAPWVGPAGAAALPARGRPPGDDRAHLGRAARDGRRRDARCAPCRCLLPVPARPRWSVPDAGRDQRSRPFPDRAGPGAVRGGRHGSRGRHAHAARHPGRQGRPALPVGPRHRPAPLRDEHAQRAPVVARPGRRRAQRPDRAPRDVQPGRRRSPRRHRRPARRDRREGPSAGRGGGPGRGAQGHRWRAQRAHRPGHPRTADPAGHRPRVCRPAGRGTEPRWAPVA